MLAYDDDFLRFLHSLLRGLMRSDERACGDNMEHFETVPPSGMARSNYCASVGAVLDSGARFA